MAPKHSLALLFHPKKNGKKEHQPPPPRRPPGTPTRQLRPPLTNDEEELQLPNSDFTDYRLMSSALNGWKYDVMKFDTRKRVEITEWTGPIKLNRKDLRRDEPATTTVPQAVGPMLGPDGKPVVGADGNVVMVDAEGKPIHSSSTNGGSTPNGKGKGAAAQNAKKKFQKKTRQVFYVPEEVRQLRREERYPWVIEDSSGGEVWVGQMEEASKSETHAFFMPAANDVFKFVPAHRWYKFQKKMRHDLPTDTANVEQFYTRQQKRDPARWLASRNGGRGPSAATAAMFKAEAEGRIVALDGSLVYNTGQSLAPGGRPLRAVDSGRDIFGDDEERGDSGRRKKETGEDGDMDEMLFEEEFADDDDKMELDGDDEETKELEERLKREYKIANKQRDGNIIESDEEEELPTMSKQAKAMQRLIRSREGNDAYESDEEKNPYASSEEEEEDEELPVITGEPAIIQQPQQVDVKPSLNTKAASTARPDATPTGARSGVPSTQSPTGSPSMGGHSLVAKRATSPKAPKPTISRDNSPSRPNTRTTTPAAGATQQLQKLNGVKRKAADDGLPTAGAPAHGVVSGTQKKKKRTTPEGELEDNMVIEWLRNTPNATTRDCLKHFKSYLVDEATRSNFTRLVKEVAQLKNGVLVLRSAYRGGGSNAPSPAPTLGA